MTATPGAWLDRVDFSAEFPNEPLVPVAVVRESPYSLALQLHGLSQLTAFYGDKQHGYDIHRAVRELIATEDLLLELGPEAADEAWRRLLGPPEKDDQVNAPISFRRYESSGYATYGRSEEYWSSRGHVPTMIGLSSVAAALYLAATGRTTRPVPLSFARVLLDPRFTFPEALSALPTLKAEPGTTLHSLWIDGEHRLVVLDQNIHFGHDGRAYPGPDSKVVHVLSEGWRLRSTPIFLGYPAEPVSRKHREGQPWEFDHDGARLVRMHAGRGADSTKSAIPIVELTDIVPDLVALLSDVQADPGQMLNEEERDRKWSERAVSPVARRIVNTALLEFAPWPHPLRLRSEAEMRIRPRDSSDAVVAMFDRLLDAPGPLRPTDLMAYFISLITRRRAEFTAWPEELAGVWGFKIKTGDHNWIEGRIWHEPGHADDPADPVDFRATASLLESTRFRERHRHHVFIETGSLRCYIQRDDT